MNRIFGLALLAIGIAACNNATGTQNSKEIETNLANEIRINDSLSLDSFKKAEFQKEIAIQKEKEVESQRLSNHSNNQASSVSDTYESSPTITPQKKGWSDAAKGTAIGAGVGAGVGALIDKDKRLRGAAIGAAIGGGSGYAIGRKSDRKSGRVQKKP